MLNSAIATISRYNMLSINDRVVAGVSGGPDSIALLHFLCSLRQRYSLHIHCVHLNHMLRGKEADEDTKFVQEFCEGLGIPCTVKYMDISKLASREKLSHEEAGRKARYQLFCDVAKDIGATRIAIAHNMNDQAETLLMRIMRGTGLDGLCGIRPVREGVYIRPFLYTSRQEIEEYCRANDLRPRTDSTNLEPVYARNKVRLELIPYMKENYNQNVEYSLSSMAELLCDDNDFLDACVNDAYKGMATEKDRGVSIDIKGLKELHGSIKKRVIRKAIEMVKGTLVGIESRHVDLILSITEEGSTGAAVELPGGLKASISYGLLRITRLNEDKAAFFCYRVKMPGTTDIPEIEGTMEAVVLNVPVDYDSRSKFIKYFDYGKIEGILNIRPRKSGDYIVPLGMKGRKKLKDLFIDSKVPREKRDRIPLVSSGGEIIWAIGYKMSDRYKISKDTKEVLKLEFKWRRGNNDVE